MLAHFSFYYILPPQSQVGSLDPIYCSARKIEARLSLFSDHPDLLLLRVHENLLSDPVGKRIKVTTVTKILAILLSFT